MSGLRAEASSGPSRRRLVSHPTRRCACLLGLVAFSTSISSPLPTDASLEPSDPFQSVLPLLRETVQLEQKLLHDAFDDGTEEEASSQTKRESEPVPVVHTERLIGWTSASWPACKDEDLGDERQLRRIASRLGEYEFQAAGYNSFVLDGCWALPERDSRGRLQPDPERFPSGIKALVDFVHGKGLRFGIGTPLDNSCAELHTLGVRADPEQDVALFTEWGVDFVKVNACGAPTRSIHEPVAKWRSVINAQVSDRVPDLVCSWMSESGSSMPEEQFYTGQVQFELDELSKACNVLNVFERTPPTWEKMKNMSAVWEAKVNGLVSRNLAELRTQFSLWVLSGAPIMLAGDITKVSQNVVDVLTERGATDVAANVDVMWGHRILGEGSTHAWMSSLFGPKFAIGISNWSDEPVTQKLDWESFKEWLGIVRDFPHEIKDIWRHEALGLLGPNASPLQFELGPHDTVLLMATLIEKPQPTEEHLPAPQMASGLPVMRRLGSGMFGSPSRSFGSPVDGPVLFPTPAFSSRPVLRGSGAVRIFRIGSIVAPPPRPLRESPFDHFVKTMDQLATQLVTTVIPDLVKDGDKSKKEGEKEVEKDGARGDQEPSGSESEDASRDKEASRGRGVLPPAKTPEEVANDAPKAPPVGAQNNAESEKTPTAKAAKARPELQKGQQRAAPAGGAKTEGGSASGEQPQEEAMQSTRRTSSWPMFVAGLVAAGLLIAFVLVGRAVMKTYTTSKAERPARMQLMQCDRPHAS
ncbi:putative alpha-galactosidase A [Neospora caninum Liverpool]|uniref:Alpha-galactosidase n=1 Tax=Neospora caninum (strain Liverpool) TaxID=572307 RepID=F0V9M0_NEOCL|nr:putative alpha-galactosidase A [Neospora caninum Liverpool]CBZ50446.1 putative alpha-galactosidase A [Neospora caninum Liverpool]|eukprot:XP_003880479.1 putative alpha-galactosidase A [Neospora caninum Liverpool]